MLQGYRGGQQFKFRNVTCVRVFVGQVLLNCLFLLIFELYCGTTQLAACNCECVNTILFYFDTPRSILFIFAWKCVD